MVIKLHDLTGCFLMKKVDKNCQNGDKIAYLKLWTSFEKNTQGRKSMQNGHLTLFYL